jgi:hypothetical protein
MLYQGKCHCGKIQFEGEGELTGILECNCSICYQSGYLHWMITPAQLKIKTPLDQAALYKWGTGKARDFFCPNCGVAVLRNPRIADPDSRYSVNIRNLEGVDISKLPITQFDGRNQLKL